MNNFKTISIQIFTLHIYQMCISDGIEWQMTAFLFIYS